jgi:predicted dehydrogenase
MNSNPIPFSRRRFLRHTAAAGVGVMAAPAFIRNLRAASPNGVQLHAAIGAAGVATNDINLMTAKGNNVKLVAVADVDLNRLLEVELEDRFSGVRIYQDYREMLAKEKDLDSVSVSTPDHMHAPIAMTAMQLGKHVYVQKPMSYTVQESRALTEYAAKNPQIVTQMGIQNHQLQHHRLVVKLIRDGAIGKVKEVYSWSNRRWGDTAPRPTRTDPVPEGFDWNLWLGASPERPFIGGRYFHPGAWRKRLDYGTGTFGDMGCHIMDPVFTALELTWPTTVRSEGPKPNEENWQAEAVVHMKFPGTAHTEPELKFLWQHNYDERPKAVVELLAGQTPHTEGSLYVGAKGLLYSPYGKPPQLLPAEQFKDFAVPEVEKGPEHHAEFARACQGKGKTTAPFAYSGPLTETVLLGCLSTRFPNTTLNWDAKSLSFTNESAANTFVRRAYRKGWEVPGLA